MQRLTFALITVFWVTMNVLLWRAEFGGGGGLGGSVPAGLVWEKILTAPDDSFLEIYQNRQSVGHCRWVANIGEELATGKIANENEQPEGMVRKLTGYRVDLDGSVELGGPNARLSFFLHTQFRTNHVWDALKLRLLLRPTVWEVRTTTADQTLRVNFEDDEQKWERTLKFDDLRRPEKLLSEFGNPLLLGLLAGVPATLDPQNLSLGLRWEARNDWLKVGHSQVRVYRLQARLLDKYQAVVMVSRVGEILRVELPNGILLLNEALQTF